MKNLNSTTAQRRKAILEELPSVITAHLPFMQVVAEFPQLRFIRHLSASETRRYFGRYSRHCTWCARPVKPPRTNWCNNNCIEEWMAINSVGKQRSLLIARDGCVCCQCGEPCIEWEADHITPVVLGGGLCTIENLRTLCIPCHRKATSELNRSLPTGGRK